MIFYCSERYSDDGNGDESLCNVDKSDENAESDIDDSCFKWGPDDNAIGMLFLLK